MGYGRGKIGDQVFYRIDGEQAFRALNRRPHNPRTNKQLVQRAIMATVMSAYSAGRAIFDHSFQGYSVGAGCQRRFLSLNANALRTLLASEWDVAAGEEALAKVTAPKIQTPVPNQYIVAEGSLTQELFTFSNQPDNIPGWTLPAIVTGEKISEYAARVGLVAGDIYTFVFIVTRKNAADALYKTYGIASVDFDIVYRGAFGWVRLITKNNAANETVITDNTPVTQLFDVEFGGVANPDFTNLIVGGDFTIQELTSDSELGATGYAIGLIKSRRDADLRSNCTLTVANPDDFGLYWNDLLTAWKAGTTEIGSSDLILEGGDE